MEFKRTEHPEAQWFPDAGLGLFLHWGISSVHGKCDISWQMIEHLPWDSSPAVKPEEYYGLAKRFNPESYDPDKWLSAAAEAGFKYAVLTTKHHDGFAMWPSEYGELSTKNYMGGRDLVRPYVEACRKYGLKVGLYYSPEDWYFIRDYKSYDFKIPNKELPAEKKSELLEYTKNQICELLTNYGRIDLIWFDGGKFLSSITPEEIRRMQPWIIMNPRLYGVGDFTTPECDLPETRPDGWWEMCDMLSTHWGYTADERYKSAEWFMELYRKVRGMGGNLLLNIPPRPDGKLADKAYQRIKEIGVAMRSEGFIS